jgi:hypothetical protein
LAEINYPNSRQGGFFDMKLTKGTIKEEKFTSTNQIMETIKEIFSEFWKKHSNVKLKSSLVMKSTNA